MGVQLQVFGKQGGYLDCLIVRCYRYADKEYNTVLDKLTLVWSSLHIPNNTKLVSLKFPQKCISYSSSDRSFPSVGRYYYSIELWSTHPAYWLVIFDGDVIPTRATALEELHEYLMKNTDAHIITRHVNTDWHELSVNFTRWANHKLRKSLNGISISAIAEGIIGINWRAIRFFSAMLPTLHRNFGFMELHLPNYLPHQLRVREFPVDIAEVTHPANTVMFTDTRPAFIQFSSERHNYTLEMLRHINSALQRVKGG